MTTEERLEKLERDLSACIHAQAEAARAKPRNRRLLIGAAVVVLGAVALAAWAFGPGAASAQRAGAALKVVRANRFLIEDENGRLRGALAVAKNGAAALQLYDGNSKLRAGLMVHSKLPPTLYLYDKNGQPLASLDGRKEGGAVCLHDPNNKLRAIVGVTKAGAGLFLYDRNGKGVWSTPR